MKCLDVEFYDHLFAACPAGQFRSEENAECQDCPANTVSPRGAAAVCPCSDGYFRNTETHTHPDALKFVEEATETASNDCTSKFA